MTVLDTAGPPEEVTGTMLVTLTVAPMPLVVVPPRFSTSNTRVPLGLTRWKTRSDTRGWFTRRPTSMDEMVWLAVTAMEFVITASSRSCTGPAEEKIDSPGTGPTVRLAITNTVCGTRLVLYKPTQ